MHQTSMTISFAQPVPDYRFWPWDFFLTNKPFNKTYFDTWWDGKFRWFTLGLALFGLQSRKSQGIPYIALPPVSETPFSQLYWRSFAHSSRKFEFLRMTEFFSMNFVCACLDEGMGEGEVQEAETQTRERESWTWQVSKESWRRGSQELNWKWFRRDVFTWVKKCTGYEWAKKRRVLRCIVLT